ncbi:hypothetical protein [Ornithinibacillus halotolerans]|uniref:Uncharacterized protein n=1 Tax=Ornithinibacillus halotolerans TaxID=1274357 RepID=A0A916W9Y5_9BACI|nr:hypothetical protein [Ornithinibacillus halotolerans]GGA79109.1 hypothetical protein GCM10008025_23190 [Ornithinibacillus halotolerans]
MGHDILGFNRGGEEIAYARFSMGNYNALILYGLLDAYDYYAGVSGNGTETTYTLEEIRKSWREFKQSNKNNACESEDEFKHWDEKQIFRFIKNCLETAEKEGSVRVYFG